MLPEFIGYASFGVGYIVYLTFLRVDGVAVYERSVYGIDLGSAWGLHMPIPLCLETCLCEV